MIIHLILRMPVLLFDVVLRIHIHRKSVVQCLTHSTAKRRRRRSPAAAALATAAQCHAMPCQHATATELTRMLLSLRGGRAHCSCPCAHVCVCLCTSCMHGCVHVCVHVCAWVHAGCMCVHGCMRVCSVWPLERCVQGSLGGRRLLSAARSGSRHVLCNAPFRRLRSFSGSRNSASCGCVALPAAEHSYSHSYSHRWPTRCLCDRWPTPRRPGGPPRSILASTHPCLVQRGSP
jgi:hypothetical protein